MDWNVMIWPDQTSPPLPVAIMICDDDDSGRHLDGEPLVAECMSGSLPLLKLHAKQAHQLGGQISAALSRLAKAKAHAR